MKEKTFESINKPTNQNAHPQTKKQVNVHKNEHNLIVKY